MNIAAYCRVSTNKEDQLNSLESQKQFFEEYAKNNNHNLVKIYADEGISGLKTRNRTEFLKMMNDSGRRLFDVLVVKDISRLARNTVDFLTCIRTLKERNIETYFLNNNQTVLGTSEFILTIFAGVAQQESENTSKRVKFGKRQNAEKGRVPNIVFGYDKIKGDYFDLKINEREADIVKRIFFLYTVQRYGTNKIAMMLNSEGIKTKRRCKWSQPAVTRVLVNEIYTGKIVNCKQEVSDFLTGKRKKKEENEWLVTEKPELRIIDDDMFRRAKSLLDERYNAFRTKRTRHSDKHLFSTLIKCADCGSSFRRRVRTYVNTYTDWVCAGRNANGVESCANSTAIYEDELIESIERYFRSLLSDKPNVIDNIIAKFTSLYAKKDDNASRKIELTSELARLNSRREKTKDLYADSLISRDEARETMTELNGQIEKFQNELSLLEYNLSKSDMLEELLNTTFKDIESVVSVNDMTNSQLKRIVDKIIVDENGNVDVYLKLLSDIGLDETYLISSNRT